MFETKCSTYYQFNEECEDVQRSYLKIVENYIEYYHRRANECKYLYYTISTIKIVLIALIPAIQLCNNSIVIKIISVLVSALVLAFESLLALYKSKDKWFLYRETCNILMSELRKFKINSKYCTICCSDVFEEFVQTIEDMIHDEARKWVQTVRKREDDKSK